MDWALAGAFIDLGAWAFVAHSGASTPTSSTSREIDRDRDVGWTTEDDVEALTRCLSIGKHFSELIDWVGLGWLPCRRGYGS